MLKELEEVVEQAKCTIRYVGESCNWFPRREYERGVSGEFIGLDGMEMAQRFGECAPIQAKRRVFNLFNDIDQM